MYTKSSAILFAISCLLFFMYSFKAKSVHSIESSNVSSKIERVSTSYDGQQAEGHSSFVSISPSGQFVVFNSSADNLVEVDNNNEGGSYSADIFIRDLETNQIELVSVHENGEHPSIGSTAGMEVDISDDGRFIVFASSQSLTNEPHNRFSYNIYLRDRQLQNTILVSSIVGDGIDYYENSENPIISSDGKYVVFSSTQANLVNEPNRGGLFLYDVESDTKRIISRTWEGVLARGDNPEISEDGRYIVFVSGDDLVNPMPVNNHLSGSHIFLYDRVLDQTMLITNVPRSSAQFNYHSNPSVSGDGRYVVFDSSDYHLVPNDTGFYSDIFLYDRTTDEFELISLAMDGNGGNGNSANAKISQDGRFIVFDSEASNLVSGDTNNKTDIFRYEIATGGMKRLTFSFNGEKVDGDATFPSISHDGQTIAFSSAASNLVPYDTNNLRDIFINKHELRKPLIFIPGIQGSYLNAEDGTLLWPQFSPLRDYNPLSLNPSSLDQGPNVYALDVIREIASTSIYKSILDHIVNQGGYVEYDVGDDPLRRTFEGCDMSQSTNNPTLFVFAYDWRKDNLENSDLLFEYYRCIQHMYPDTEVDIVAHSMGGLIASHFMLSNPGVVDNLITIGTPFLGAPKAVSVLETGDQGFPITPLMIGPTKLKELAEFFPGSHQLLPSPHYFVVGSSPVGERGWDLDNDGNSYEEYDVNNYTSVFNERFESDPITNNLDFHTTHQDNWETLNTQTSLWHFVGDTGKKSTPGSVHAKTTWLMRVGSYERVDWWEVETTTGDETVPLISSTRIGNNAQLNAPGANIIIVTENAEHLELTKNETVHSDLLAILNGQSLPSKREYPYNKQRVIATNKVTLIGLDTFSLENAAGVKVDVIDGEPQQPLHEDMVLWLLGDKAFTFIVNADEHYSIGFEISSEPTFIEVIQEDQNGTKWLKRYLDVSLESEKDGKLYLKKEAVHLRYDSSGTGDFNVEIALNIDRSDSLISDVAPPIVDVTINENNEVTFIASDQEAGVAKIYYSLNGEVFDLYSNPFSIYQESNIRFFAEDFVGNRSELYSQNLSLYIDPSPTSISTVIPTPTNTPIATNTTPSPIPTPTNTPIATNTTPPPPIPSPTNTPIATNTPPPPTPTPNTSTKLFAGGYHACAITNSGGLKCWGENAFGKLGDGTYLDRSTPVQVNGLTAGVTHVAVGENHTCAVVNRGVKCWGHNYNGQLGNGTYDSSTVPVDVTGLLNGVLSVEAGADHSCALLENGTVRCWGWNLHGQLGNGSEHGTYSTPVNVINLSANIMQITTGDSHSCALSSSGSVQCWGYGVYGQLGDGTSTYQTGTPVNVNLNEPATQITAGYAHTCAIVNGSAMCWGWNEDGGLGDGSTSDKSTPVAVVALSSGVSNISAGFRHTCASTSSGGAKCWGHNGSGRLGNATNSASITPVNVHGLVTEVSDVSVGYHFSCALMENESMACWGFNIYGALGNGSTTNSNVPTAVQCYFHSVFIPLIIR